MNDVFPLGFAGPTAFYLVLFVLTWAVHYLFVSYIVAGTALLLVARFVRHPGLAVLARATSEFSTFAMSAAITAGVAPLLFVQILYRARMYTASLLLSHRFMALLPALIVAFYALYAQKTRYAEARPRVRAGLTALALGAIGFAAGSWVDNHVLSRHAATWPAVFAAGPLSYENAEKVPRLALYLGLTPLVFAPQLALQLVLRERKGEDVAAGLRALSWLATLAVGAAAFGVMVGLSRLPGLLVAARSRAGIAYAIAGALALGATFAMVRRVSRSPSVGAAAVGVTTALVAALAVAVQRELVRLGGLDLALLEADHREALSKGGMWLFFAFLLVNTALCVWIVRAVAKAPRPAG